MSIKDKDFDPLNSDMTIWGKIPERLKALFKQMLIEPGVTAYHLNNSGEWDLMKDNGTFGLGFSEVYKIIPTNPEPKIIKYFVKNSEKVFVPEMIMICFTINGSEYALTAALYMDRFAYYEYRDGSKSSEPRMLVYNHTVGLGEYVQTETPVNVCFWDKLK